MLKKKLIVVILGAKRINPRAHWAKKVLLFLFNLLHVTSFADYKQQLNWRKYFKSDNTEVIYLHWGRGVGLLSRILALKKLKKIVHQYKNTHEITLIGHSLGGDVAMEACKQFDGIIKKVILLFSANESKKSTLKMTKIINIYSPYDFFVRMAIMILAPIAGGQKLIGENIVNIPLAHFEHEEVFLDKKIKGGKFRGKTISELINTLI
jgi:pimeloyl-ACP methyl ester carboxylesterase